MFVTKTISPGRLLCSGTLAAICLAPLGAAEQLADNDIKAAVLDSLMISPRVFSGDVTVAVDEGTVQLRGTVDNLLARRRAVRLASLTKGVRVVDNDLAVEPVQIADEELESDIENALLEGPAAESYEVAVSVDDAVATLSGTVDSWQEREMAAFATMGVRGLRGIENQIEVTYQQDRLDVDIQQDIASAIEMDPYLEAYQLTVTVDDGAVDIDGKVGSLYEKQLLRGHAWTSGVDTIDIDGVSIEWYLEDDDLEQPKQRVDRDDAAIASAVSYRLDRDPKLEDDDISVEVDDGTVRLYGTVETIRDRSAAERSARLISGVLRVRNYLTVTPSRELSEQGLIAEVGEALSRDPWIERYEIDLSASEGRIYLDGKVDSRWERQHAEEVVERVEGVTGIYNWLLVESGGLADREHAYYDYDYGTSYGYDYYQPLYDDDMELSQASSDWEIREDIRDELFWSPFVDEDDITVTVNDGVADLDGSVADWDEYWAARANAFEGGATQVLSGGLDVQSMSN